MARALAANGASKVYIVGRRKEKLEGAAKEYANIVPLPGDVTSKDSLRAIAAQVKSEVGYVNLLVANSGIIGPNTVSSLPENASVADFAAKEFETPMEDFTRTFALNTTSVYYTALAFLELLDAGSTKGFAGGQVNSQFVVTASIGGLHRSPMTGFAYNPSKAAVIHLVKMLATYLGPKGIRCNILAPGVFPSEMTDPFLRETSEAELAGKMKIPEKRLGSEEDAAGTILWLASRAGAYCNGNVVVLDGGRLSQQPATY
ncbi:NAD(P)-binding protein [Saccharata proteae CBS 121410]|uniref:NAD(P)-binding protein n=1 Tax=Saccharata proteae CBS 121410 TaxID=1314787 RepID=A0A9P4LT33_9PEZI|nr:NAD(P)-binding protein [Saccharata proteae CBS 121410]